MKIGWIVIAIAALIAGVAADPALARVKHKAKPQCADRPQVFSWSGILFNPPPQPNGCAPAVFFGGKFIGQDPDPFIRLQLRRDPRTGVTPY